MYDPLAFYLSRSADAGRRASAAEQVTLRLSIARLVVFTAAVFGVFWAWTDAVWLRRGTAGALAGVFIVLVVAHRRWVARLKAARAIVAACEAGAARVKRDWDRVAPLRLTLPDTASPGARALVRDLDLLGPVSLARLLDVVSPALGGVRLLGWLTEDPPPAAELRGRQLSVKALRERGELLLDMSVIGRRRDQRQRTSPIERFSDWSGRRHRMVRRWWRPLSVAVTVVLVGAGIGAWVAADSAPWITLIWGAAIAQLILTARARRLLHRELAGLEDLFVHLRLAVASAVRIIAEPAVEGRLGELQRVLGAAPGALAALERTLSWDATRNSPMGHWTLNAMIGLDVHIAAAIDRWRSRHGSDVIEWMSALSEAEALVALGTLAFDNPRWALPEFVESDAPLIDADDVGHPLLAEERRVANPVSLPAAGSVLVVSGSNMAGKTTYLRSIAVNTLLAHCGGPVCATRDRRRLTRPRTSVRVEDDLSRGVSLFLAEVTRLADIVVDADRAGEPPVLFLLDEILHGTNAPDRRYATGRVLHNLVRAGAAGVVTTHDPDIGELITDSPSVTHLHFRETVQRSDDGRVEMTFDYTVRPGPARTANARVVLEMLGLG